MVIRKNNNKSVIHIKLGKEVLKIVDYFKYLRLILCQHDKMECEKMEGSVKGSKVNG